MLYGKKVGWIKIKKSIQLSKIDFLVKKLVFSGQKNSRNLDNPSQDV